ncbi:Putative molybdenum carrier [Maioricimonas rarisocia]|uniref:Molybdenum carrier n=1 Tax=Maioricimonas rarisocia TaxID=2528026 RepID=A0A517ZC58_9PLAN|nr:putative molybdenum carrier protein [Maioricimonas rarisocia]QDU40030.1 Putative molybdenum carrier [Maioricimonas rarisocia]
MLKIVSGGQTGVDRAALDAAMGLKLPHGGWCPQGRRAEDGVIPARYQLQESKSRQYAVRTRWNVRDSDGTLILARATLNGGTALTADVAASLGRPCLVVDPASAGSANTARQWMKTHSIRVLNVAGPRESSDPGIYEVALRFLRRLLRQPVQTKRRGARSLSDVTSELLDGLQRGELETRTLSEGLAIDFAVLLQHAAPEVTLTDEELATLAKPHGITRRMEAAGQLLLRHVGMDRASIERFSGHPSDTVRGWAAYMVGGMPDLSLARRLQLVRPLADDPHFGVREWAWLALRSHIAEDVETSIARLQRWTNSRSGNLRRYAVESTRPRGVWCAHIGELKTSPEMAMPLLEPLKSDPAKYVQDSVANWLNDASKSQAEWVQELCLRWETESPTDATRRICRRAQRTLRKTGRQ